MSVHGALRRRRQHVPAAIHRLVDEPPAGHGDQLHRVRRRQRQRHACPVPRRPTATSSCQPRRRRTPPPQGAVVTLGASITDGYASTTDANERWPNDLAVRLSAAGRTIGVLNQGISGNRLLVDGSGQSALESLQPRRALAAWRQVGDLLRRPDQRPRDTSPPPTSAQLIAGLQQLISRPTRTGSSSSARR